ncbi:platelet formation protein family [Trichomonas vaginalis G3]|uniref:platelet formation protein family n=1 Tax=Trichomonas vaginalis (strain ATCC PRA-98 / G3) TaxID=412133 RepID=UPI0021E59D88|nr:platelet formation protein family [Trichomonas vaginalis G3]KAI5496327.1 platelet formation protein family [Trichomonas vaginalis G3]
MNSKQSKFTHLIQVLFPRQIFNYPHPKRIYTRQMSITRLMLLGTKLCWNILMKFKSPVVFIGQSNNSIPILTAQSDFLSIPLSSKWRSSVQDNSIKQVPLATIKKYVTLADTEHNFFVITSRSFEYIQESCLFVASSPWDSTFHVFKVESNSAHYIYSQRQNSSLISGVTSSHKKGLIVTRWQDSSISVWDVEKPQQNCFLYRIQPHLTSLVDVDVCSNLNIIVSLDKSRTVIMTKLSSGHYMRHFIVEGNDTLKKLLIVSAGYIIIASESSTNGRFTSTFRCYTFNSILLKTFSYESTLSCLACIKSSTSPMLVASFSDGHFSLIEIPQMLEIISTKKFTMTNIVYNEEHNCLFASDSNGNLLYLDL